jgi:hypothetical protein
MAESFRSSDFSDLTRLDEVFSFSSRSLFCPTVASFSGIGLRYFKSDMDRGDAIFNLENDFILKVVQAADCGGRVPAAAPVLANGQ